MKRFTNAFFLFLGVIFFLILIALGYMFATDTFGIKSLLTNRAAPSSETESNTSGNADKNPLLSESQEKMLENLGVDPAKLPSTITPAMAICFEEKLGKERAEEIKKGDSPTATDYFKAQSCF